MAFTCPTCGTPIVGTVHVFMKHTSKCGKPRKAKGSSSAPAQPAKSMTALQLPMTFYLTTAIPSQNTAGHTKHWSAYQRIRQQWRDVVQYEMAAVVGMEFTWSRWHFLRLIPKRGKFYDHSNICGGAKSFVDSLTWHGVIKDDADKYFKADYEQVRFEDWVQGISSGFANVRTVVTLQEATP